MDGQVKVSKKILLKIKKLMDIIPKLKYFTDRFRNKN